MQFLIIMKVNSDVSLINLTDNEDNINSTEQSLSSTSQLKEFATASTTGNKKQIEMPSCLLYI